MNLCSHRTTRRRHWSTSLPCIYSGRGGSPRQRHSFRCVIASCVTTDTALNLKTKEFGVDLPAGRQAQFVELYRILMALRNKDIKPALEYVPPFDLGAYTSSPLCCFQVGRTQSRLFTFPLFVSRVLSSPIRVSSPSPHT